MSRQQCVENAHLLGVLGRHLGDFSYYTAGEAGAAGDAGFGGAADTLIGVTVDHEGGAGSA